MNENNNIIQEEIKANLKSEENILYNYRVEFIKPIMKYISYIGIIEIISIIIILIFLGIFIFPILNFSYFHSIILIFMLTTLGAVIAVMLFVIKKFYKKKYITQLILTDLMVHSYKKYVIKEYITCVNLNEINLPIFYKVRFFEKKGDYGSLQLIYNKWKNITFFSNIPRFSIFIRIFESILFHYGGVEEQVLDKAKLDLPIEFSIDQDGMKSIKRAKYVIWIAIALFIIIAIIILIFCIIIYYNNVPDLLSRLIIGISGSILLFFGAIAFYYILRKLDEKTSKLDDKLILTENSLEIITQETNVVKEFNKDSILNIKVLSGNLGYSYKQKNALELKSSIDDNDSLLFGPVSNDIFKIIYNNLLRWKNKQGYLLSKEELNELQKNELINSENNPTDSFIREE